MKKLRSSAEILKDLTNYQDALTDLQQRQKRGEATMSGYDPKMEYNVDSTTMYYEAMIQYYESEIKELKRCGEQLAFNF